MSKETDDAMDKALREGVASGVLKPRPAPKPTPKPAPKANDSDDDDMSSYAKGGAVHGDEAEDTALFNRLMAKHQNPGSKYAKGGAIETRGYAKGGEVLGRRREFMKEPDPFSAGSVGGAAADSSFIKMHADPGSPQEYTKGKNKYPGKDKSLKTVTPRE